MNSQTEGNEFPSPKVMNSQTEGNEFPSPKVMNLVAVGETHGTPRTPPRSAKRINSVSLKVINLVAGRCNPWNTTRTHRIRASGSRRLRHSYKSNVYEQIFTPVSGGCNKAFCNYWSLNRAVRLIGYADRIVIPYRDRRGSIRSVGFTARLPYLSPSVNPYFITFYNNDFILRHS